MMRACRPRTHTAEKPEIVWTVIQYLSQSGFAIKRESAFAPELCDQHRHHRCCITIASPRGTPKIRRTP
jgi:hypothetical protein